MDSFDLFVGDTVLELGEIARTANSDAYLITPTNLNDYHRGTVFASFPDLNSSHSDFFNILSRAKKIICIFPTVWSDNKTTLEKYSLGWHTANYVQLVTDLCRIPVKNFTRVTIETPASNYKLRASNQIWLTGCSTSFGTGVDKKKKYSSLLEDKLNRSIENISTPGSSNKWQAQQLLCSNIRKDNLIIWGLTEIARTTWFSRGVLHHVNTASYSQKPSLINYIPLDYLDSDHSTFESLIAIDAVQNYCNTIGARLLLVGIHANLELSSQLSHKDNFLFIGSANLSNPFSPSFIDYGDDKIHPGPKTHELYAEKIFSKLKQLNWI